MIMNLRSSVCWLALALCLVSGITVVAQENEQKSSGPLRAVAVLRPTEGNKVRGIVTFTEVADGVRVDAHITGLTPGKHGFHVHEFGDCSSADGSAAEASAAGDHFNPAKNPHGAPDSAARHEGDMGNIEADASGAAKLNYVDHSLSLHDGEESIIGRSVIVHEKADDLKSQPSGDAGARIACGVIGRVKSN
jgi:superoxide dismutase, Cu-Zn family